MTGTMNLTLKVWRQAGPKSEGEGSTEYKATDVSPDMSFLEMLDVVNERLIAKGEVPIAFDHDCREGICGMCGMMINGVAHGPMKGTATCQLHMRSFKDGDTIVIEPWRAQGRFRSSRISSSIAARSTASSRRAATSRSPPAARRTATRFPFRRSTPNRRWTPRRASAAARASPRARTPRRRCSPSAKISHLGLLPQGQPERYRRALKMVAQMDLESFGGCTLFGECQEACPKEISIDFISRMNRDFICAASVTTVDEH